LELFDDIKLTLQLTARGLRLVAHRVVKSLNTTLLRLLAAIMISYSELSNWDEAFQRFKEEKSVEELRRMGYAVEDVLRITERLRAKVNLVPERAREGCETGVEDCSKVSVD